MSGSVPHAGNPARDWEMDMGPRRKRFVMICLVALCALVVLRAGADEKEPATRPAKVRITISKETTRILGPLNADGTVNYLAALDARLRKGVTRENNALIPLLRAVGPTLIDEKVRAGVLKRLGMESLPERGEYYIDLWDYAGSHESQEEADEALDRAMDAPWKEKDIPLIAGWLKANDKALALAVEATKRPRYYVPAVGVHDPPRMFDMLLGVRASGVRDIGRALGARANKEAAEGNGDAARRDLVAIHHLAHLLTRCDRFIDVVVGMGFEKQACRADRAAASGLTAEQAKALLADLRALPPFPGLRGTIDNGERYFALDCVMMFASSSLKGEQALLDTIDSIERPGDAATRRESPAGPAAIQEAIDWDEILRTMNHWYDRMVYALGKRTYAEKCEALAALSKELDALCPGARKNGSTQSLFRSLLDLTPEKREKLRRRKCRAIGNLSVGSLVRYLSKANYLHQRMMQDRDLTYICLALAAYKAERGSFPTELTGLAPKYLQAVPKDLFTGKPLIYRLRGDGYVLYSAGRNMTDDGGRKDSDDIVVTVGRDAAEEKGAPGVRTGPGEGLPPMPPGTGE